MKAHDDDDAAGCSSGDAGRAATEAVMNLIGEWDEWLSAAC